MPVKTTQIYQVIRNTIIISASLLFIFWMWVLISANCYVKTHVRADFKLRKEISFVVNEPTRFSSIPFDFLQIGKFSQMVIPSNKLVPSEKQVALPLNIKPESDLSTVQFQSSKENGKKQLARLSSFEVPEGTKITLRIDEDNSNKLEIKLEGKLQAPFNIHPPEASLRLVADNCQFDGDYQPPNNEEVTLKFAEISDVITFNPLGIDSDSTVELSLVLNSDLELPIYSQGGIVKVNKLYQHPIFLNPESIKIKNLELFYRNERREKRTSLIGGQVYCIGYPKKDAVALRDTDRVEFDKAEQLSLEKISFSPADSIEFAGSSLDLRVQGVLTHKVEIATLSSKDTEFPRVELRLTQYDSWTKWEFFDIISGSMTLIITIFSALIGLFAAGFEKDD